MRRRVPFFTRLTGSALSVIYFCTQVAFASAPERTLWTQRRAATHRFQAQLAMAGLPVTPTRPALSPPALLPSPTTPPAASLSSLVSLLSVDATVRDVRAARTTRAGRAAPVIVYIQDVHGEPEAQKNIAAVISKLLRREPATVVGLEGASGRIPIESFRPYAPSLNREIGSFLLNTGLITGAEYAGIAADVAPRFVGLEDPVLYRRNIDAVRRALRDRKGRLDAVLADEAALQRRKEDVYSPALRAFDRRWRDYHAGTLNVGDYLAALAAIAPPSPRFSEIRLFEGAWALEKSIDFTRAERERDVFISQLAGRLGPTALNDLVQRTLALRTGALPYPEYYRALRSTAARAGLSLSAAPEFDRYVAYILEADAIRPEPFLAEVAAYETAVSGALCRTPAQRALCDASTRLGLTEKLVRLTLTPSEWSAYKKWRSAGRLAPFEAFYEAAEARNAALASRFVAARAASGARVAVLVAGGYHSDGLERGLAGAATFITVTPKLTHVTSASDNAYLNVFTQDKTPLEKLFEAPRISLIKPLATADPSQVAVRRLMEEFGPVVERALPNGTASRKMGNHTDVAAAAGRALPPPAEGDKPILQGESDTGAHLAVYAAPDADGGPRYAADGESVWKEQWKYLTTATLPVAVLGLMTPALSGAFFLVAAFTAAVASAVILARGRASFVASHEIIRFAETLVEFETKILGNLEIYDEYRNPFEAEFPMEEGQNEINRQTLIGGGLVPGLARFTREVLDQIPHGDRRRRDLAENVLERLFESALVRDAAEQLIAMMRRNGRENGTILRVLHSFRQPDRVRISPVRPRDVIRDYPRYLARAYWTFGIVTVASAFAIWGIAPLVLPAVLVSAGPLAVAGLSVTGALVGAFWIGSGVHGLSNRMFPWREGYAASATPSENRADGHGAQVSLVIPLHLDERNLDAFRNRLDAAGPGGSAWTYDEMTRTVPDIPAARSFVAALSQLGAVGRRPTESDVDRAIADHRLNDAEQAALRSLASSGREAPAAEAARGVSPENKTATTDASGRRDGSSVGERPGLYRAADRLLHDQSIGTSRWALSEYRKLRKDDFENPGFFTGEAHALFRRENLTRRLLLVAGLNWAASHRRPNPSGARVQGDLLTSLGLHDVAHHGAELQVIADAGAQADRMTRLGTSHDALQIAEASAPTYVRSIPLSDFRAFWMLADRDFFESLVRETVSSDAGLRREYLDIVDELFPRAPGAPAWSPFSPSSRAALAVGQILEKSRDALVRLAGQKERSAADVQAAQAAVDHAAAALDALHGRNEADHAANEPTASLRLVDVSRILNEPGAVSGVAESLGRAAEKLYRAVLFQPFVRRTADNPQARPLDDGSAARAVASSDPTRAPAGLSNLGAGDVVPGTQFQLGRENNEAQIRSLSQWVEYPRYAKSLQPGQSAQSGFVGAGEDFIDVLVAQWNVRQALGISAAQFGAWLRQVIDAPGDVAVVNGQPIRRNVTQYRQTTEAKRGMQDPPLPGVEPSSQDIVLSNDNTGVKLSGIVTHVHIGLIGQWGFSESGRGNRYAVDFVELAALFTGQSVESIRQKMAAGIPVTTAPMPIVDAVIPATPATPPTGAGSLGDEIKKYAGHRTVREATGITGDGAAVAVFDAGQDQYIVVLNRGASFETFHVKGEMTRGAGIKLAFGGHELFFGGFGGTVFDGKPMTRTGGTWLDNAFYRRHLAAGVELLRNVALVAFVFALHSDVYRALPPALSLPIALIGTLIAMASVPLLFKYGHVPGRGWAATRSDPAIKHLTRLFAGSTLPLLALPVYPVAALIVYAAVLVPLICYHHRVDNPLGRDVTRRADEAEAVRANGEVAAFLTTLLEPLQRDVLAKWRLTGANAVLGRRIQAQIEIARQDAAAVSDRRALRFEFGNALYLAGRAGLSFEAARALVTPVMTELGAGTVSLRMRLAWAAGRVVGFVAGLGAWSRRPFYDAGSAKNLPDRVVVGFHVDPLMDDSGEDAELRNDTETHVLRRIETFDARDEAHRPNDVLVVRSALSDAGDIEAFRSRVKDRIRERALARGGPAAAHVDAYLARVDVDVQPLGLIDQQRLLDDAARRRGVRPADIRFDLYTAMPQAIDTTNPVVQVVIYALLSGLRVAPLAETLEVARVVSLNA